MMNMSSQLTVADLDLIPLSNITFQKCLVNPVTLARIGGKLASHIMLTSSFCDVICQAFPNDQVQVDVIKYCKRVFKNNIGLPSLAENYMKNNVLKKIDKNRDKCIDVKQNSLVNVKLLKTAPAKQVEITLVADDYQNIKCFKKDLKYHSGKLEEMCRNLLLKFCVADGHVVSFEKIPLAKQNGLYCIVINSCYHDDNNFDGYIITQQTDICICKIVSKERHFQKSHEKSLEVGGLDREAEELCEILKIPFLFKSDLLGEFRKVLPKGILLRGPAGTGKTSLVRHVGNECNAFVVTINGPEVFGARPGETEENLTKIFDKVLIFSEEGPTILFLDEVDTLCPDKRNSDGEKEINSSRMLMDFFDRIVENDNIMVIGATNRPMSVDAGLRRPGRFDKEVKKICNTINRFKIHKKP